VRSPRSGCYRIDTRLPKTRHSQCIGGMIGGIGMALRELPVTPDKLL
jgi:hypothetical protein